MTFADLYEKGSWQPIRNCPGRYRLTNASPQLEPQDLVGADAIVREYKVPAARDPVLVVRVTGGGLLSYRREDGTYFHSLNTDEGLERKLSQLGIPLLFD